MSNLYQSSQKRDYDLNLIIPDAYNRSSCREFDFLKEPTKYLNLGESTYSDHFGPKTNFPPPHSQGPFAVPLTCYRAKQMVSTTQQDYDRREIGTFTGNISGNDSESKTKVSDNIKKSRFHREIPEEILTTIGPIPLVKTCRQKQEWETTYNKDFEFIPPIERIFPFPE